MSEVTKSCLIHFETGGMRQVMSKITVLTSEGFPLLQNNMKVLWYGNPANCREGMEVLTYTYRYDKAVY